MRYICLLGRQPEIGFAELSRLYDNGSVSQFSNEAAIVEADKMDVELLGGTIKIGRIVHHMDSTDWKRIAQWTVREYEQQWKTLDHKQTLGISVYGLGVGTKMIQTVGLQLKSILKKHQVSLRLVPNKEPAHSSAVSHHNKLGLSDNKSELLIFSNRNETIIAESIGAQNITSLAQRDQGRPRRDAFVGMLPPKLAQIMINLANPTENTRILDPFCGTGVVLQEAALKGHSVYGTDLSEKMVRYSIDNLNWLSESRHINFDRQIHEGDAMETTWQQPIGAVVCETYLGQPFSAPPAPDKLEKVVRICDAIVTKFLTNIAPQLEKDTPVCLAVPAWKNKNDQFTHLPVTKKIESLGYTVDTISHGLLYYREDQIVARQLIVCKKK